MRIAVVHSFYSSDSPSGENRAVESQVSALRSAGHEVLLVSRETDSESMRKFYKVQSSLTAMHIAGPNPDSELKSFRPDIVHVHNLFPNWSGKWMKGWSDRTVSTLHNFRSVCAAGVLWRSGDACTLCPDQGSWHAVRNKCYRGSMLATIPSAIASRNSGSKSPLLMFSRKLVVLNSFAESYFNSLNIDSDVIKVANFVPRSRAVSGEDSRYGWIFVGRLTEEKGIRWLLKNWPREFQLSIIGAGPLQSEVEEACAAEPKRFRYIGNVTQVEVIRLLRKSQGLVLPSLWAEGLPTVAIEALEAGCGVVVSRHCASAEELVDGGGGMIFSVEDGTAGLRGALEAIDSSENIPELARASFNRRYSEESWVENIETVYADILNSSK